MTQPPTPLRSEGAYSAEQRGSALMLVPAGVLCLVILAAVSVDSGVAFLARRELSNQAAAAVNDAATQAIPAESLQTGERAAPQLYMAEQVVHSRLDGFGVAGLVVRPGDVVTTVDNETVSVVVEGDVPYLFAKAIPGAKSQAHVRATASAVVELR